MLVISLSFNWLMEEYLRPESHGVACLLCVSKDLVLYKRHLSLVVAFVFLHVLLKGANCLG